MAPISGKFDMVGTPAARQRLMSVGAAAFTPVSASSQNTSMPRETTTSAALVISVTVAPLASMSSMPSSPATLRASLALASALGSAGL